MSFEALPMSGRTSLFFVTLTAAACSFSSEPKFTVKLFVMNATCISNQCAPVQVLGFPTTQPSQLLTPGTFVRLGSVTGPSDCLIIPWSGEFHVTVGTTEPMTRTYNWSLTDSFSLGTMDSARLIFQSPSTEKFVPGNLSGWSVTLPGSAAPVPAQLC